MASKTYIVDGRQFRTERDYQDAMHDQEIIKKLRKALEHAGVEEWKDTLERGERGEYHFRTLLGEDFLDEVRERIRRAQTSPSPRRSKMVASSGERTVKPVTKKRTEGGTPGKRTPGEEKALQEAVRRELRRQERRRRLFLLGSGLLAVVFLGVFGWQAYRDARVREQNRRLGLLLTQERPGNESSLQEEGGPVQITLDGEREIPEILPEYQAVYQKNKRLIGWLRFDDKEIGGEYGFPVMQTVDNEYYLNHDFDQNVDKNGTIFMDTGCDVLKPSDNFILYGHHMKSGAMFGRLDRYAKESYYQKYPYLEFDTIYEKGIYQVVYVFRSRVYKEDEVVFKYYQFIDAISQQEFDSYMEEMAAMSLYDTGVTPQYGDQLLTLSTCDYQETNGRFVVVARKVAFRE